MIYYYNPNNDSVIQIENELTPEKADELEMEHSSLISELNNLKTLNTRDFNYYLFEEDLEGLTPEEFEYLFTKEFQPWIEKIEENFLDINFEKHLVDFQDQGDKKLYFKKLVFFIMHVFPYDILSTVLGNPNILEKIIPDEDQLTINPKNINEVDFQKILDIDYNNNLPNLKEAIILELEKKNQKLDNWVEQLDYLSTIVKKNTISESKDLIVEHVNKMKKVNRIYELIIYDTSLEKLNDLIQEYLKNDYVNIIDHL